MCDSQEPRDSRRRSVFVVSNREPYLHHYGADGGVECVPTTGGVAVALDALMRERGGVWIAHGGGEADRVVVDAHDRVRVPPEEPAYTLRRIWLSDDEEGGYYRGFANEGLWPLCHMAHVRPMFRSRDWTHYQTVNRRFAEVIDAELGVSQAPVFIHDYHLALVASELRGRRPDVRTAHFWHIPWPHPDRLRMCPWRREIITGLLSNDLVAFQLERDRRNFLAAVRDELSVEVSFRQGTVREPSGRTVGVYATPIGVDFDRIQKIATDRDLEVDTARLRSELGIRTPIVGVGVDRLDYTKGIPERLEALDVLLSKRPDLREQMTFVQIGVPSRSKIGSYEAIESAIDQKVAEINVKYARTGDRGPIRYRKAALQTRRLVALYRLADFCVVSSLHDGMNLVAKEYVAAHEDLGGVLVLSELAGAAQELREAVMINPYDVDGFASALEGAIDMPAGERERRMWQLRRIVAGRDVFRWATDILEELESLPRGAIPLRPAPAVMRSPTAAVGSARRVPDRLHPPLAAGAEGRTPAPATVPFPGRDRRPPR